MLSWQWPWLLFLLPLPWLARRFLPAYESRSVALRVPFYDALAGIQSSTVVHVRSKSNALLCTTAWALLVLAIARPVWFGEPVSIEDSGRDLMLAVDLSDSMRIDDMLEGDVYVTRMHAIKTLAGEFIEQRRGDRVGLILFGQRAYLQTPLTFDRQSVVIQLREALPGFAGSSTAIGDAIGKAISVLRDQSSDSRVLLLLTDGSNTSGSDPDEAIDIAIEAQIKIHTIGVGADFKQVVDITGRKRDIDPSRDLDENTLQTISSMTGGRYFRARDPADLATIYEVIDELEPLPQERVIRPQRSLYHWPLSMSVLLFIVLLFFRRGLDR